MMLQLNSSLVNRCLTNTNCVWSNDIRLKQTVSASSGLKCKFESCQANIQYMMEIQYIIIESTKELELKIKSITPYIVYCE